MKGILGRATLIGETFIMSVYCLVKAIQFYRQELDLIKLQYSNRKKTNTAFCEKQSLN